MQIKAIPRASRHISPIFWIGVIALSVLGSTVSEEYIKNGISLCINTVIPAVFPFMIISSLITVSGSATDIGSFFRAPMKLIFGVEPEGACAISLGLLCGYPVGALSGAEMFDRGEISKSELEYLLTFINLPSAPFVIGGVGASMLSSRKMGIAIYVSVILSALIVGIILRPFNKSEKSPNKKITSSRAPVPISYVITESISRAAKNMLGVCACVITFSALSGTLCSVLPLPDIIKAAISGFFEVSSGAKAASSVSNQAYAPLLCASTCAFSGLSVHFQIISACRGRGISFVSFFISKVAQAVLSPLLLSLYIAFCR